MSDPTTPYRHIAPGPSPTPESPPREIHKSPTGGSWKKRVSTACSACKKSKRKCSGVPPCDNCRAFNRVCVFDESLDQRRRVAAKRTAEELNYHRDMLNDLFKVIRKADESHALKLLDIIRKNATSEEIRAFIDETLVRIEGTEKETEETVNKLEDVRRMINVEGAGPSFRRKVMDIHYLCDEAPCKVPAKPWTTVTEDADLVSHLVSLYFTWDYPFHTFLDRNVFLKHMASGDLESEFCTPFLVNAVLANACHFSEFSEAYVVPGDLVTKGADFLSEAERLREEDTQKLSLAFLQGTLLLYERYSISGNDDLGYHMLHQAIRTGEALGFYGPKYLKLEEVPEDMDISIKRTAWGLFHIDTVVHTGFLRPSLIDKVNVDRPSKETTGGDAGLWTPYPSHRAARPSYLYQYFEESCNLCEIARDISRALFSDDSSTSSASFRRQVKEELYERLRRWHNSLPDIFDPGRRPPPHIILLRMRYFTLVINLFSCNLDDDNSSSVASEAPHTPESAPRQSPIAKYNAWEITQSAARGISSLSRLHRREYGMSRAHHFAMYAVNLALFTMLEQDNFNILDSDFLSLASAFSIIASRSHLGRNLFHIFRQSVRAKSQGHRIRESGAVSDELKDLFDEESSKEQSRWDDYADGLEKLNEDERYHGIGGEGEHGLQDYPGLGLFDMLDRYESLSLGKDEIVPERQKPDQC